MPDFKRGVPAVASIPLFSVFSYELPTNTNMKKDTILPVSLASAKLFVTQCIGSYSGHMSDIAFSPTIRAIADAHGVNTCAWCGKDTQEEFAHFLRMIADELSPENVVWSHKILI
jgi:hypothetical protein